MAGLLNASQIAQIRGAIKQVTDTFAITPVTLYKINVVDDLYMEDRDSVSATQFNVQALVEYTEEDEEQEQNGSVDYNESKLTLNVDDMITAGVVLPVSGEPTFEHVFKTEQDYFKLKGVLYRITDIFFDGPLEEKDVLLIIKGTKSQTRMNFM